MCRHGATWLTWSVVAAIAGCFWFAHGQPLQAQASPVDGTIRGTVIDVVRDRPVVAATVHVLDEADRIRGEAITDEAGQFLLPRLAPGAFRLRVRALGYAEVVSPHWRVESGEVLTVVLRVHPDAILLAPLEVTASSRTDTPVLERFYDRMDRGISGVFFDRQQIQARNPMRITDLLADVPGVRLVGAADDGDPRRDQIIRFSRSLGQCPAQIFVDGLPANRGGQEIPLDVLASPAMLEGIEVYRGLSGVPPEFLSADARCGVVALWTRRAGTRSDPDR